MKTHLLHRGTPRGVVHQAPSVASSLATALSVEALPQCRNRSPLRSDLSCSIKDSAFFSVMVGIGETYIPAFALALGLGEIAAGLVISIPMLIGGLLQMIAPWGATRLKSNRRWALICVVLQASSFLPLIAAALWGSASAWFIYASVSLYWAAGLACSPAWNAWMETVVPTRVRARFFALRTRLGQAGILLGFLAGGLVLQYAKAHNSVLLAFAGIFAVAAICRVVSVQYLFRQHESPVSQGTQRHVSPWELMKRIIAGGSERALLYFLAVQVAVQISGPYFTPYMLRQVRLSYIEYVVLLAVSFLGKIAVLPTMGRLAHRYGTRWLLWVGGIGIIPISGMWLYCHSFESILVLQFVGGMAWAAYELAMFLQFFETIHREERTSVLTCFNLANAVALAIGAAIGGAMLKLLGEGPEAYLVLFALSSLARALTLICLRLTAPKRAVVAHDEHVDLSLSDIELGESLLGAEVPDSVPHVIPEPRHRPAGSTMPVPATVSAPAK